MSDNGKEIPQAPQPEAPKDLVLTITLSAQTGKVNVSGPGNEQLFDEPMCFWMLEKAKDSIKIANAKAAQSRIITPPQPRIRNIFGRH